MEHYFSNKPTSKGKQTIINYSVKNIDFKFKTLSGVFSKDHVDRGTDLLIKKCRIEGNKILDIGCGYGPVGICLSILHPDSEITMTDVNERALDLTQKNLGLNNTEATVLKSDLFTNLTEKFDQILSNPPQHAGKKVCIQLIKDAKKHLNKNGTFQLVARHQKGGKHLSQIMEEEYGNLEVLGKQGGFRLYLSKLL